MAKPYKAIIHLSLTGYRMKPYYKNGRVALNDASAGHRTIAGAKGAAKRIGIPLSRIEVTVKSRGPIKHGKKNPMAKGHIKSTKKKVVGITVYLLTMSPTNKRLAAAVMLGTGTGQLYRTNAQAKAAYKRIKSGAALDRFYDSQNTMRFNRSILKSRYAVASRLGIDSYML